MYLWMTWHSSPGVLCTSCILLAAHTKAQRNLSSSKSRTQTPSCACWQVPRHPQACTALEYQGEGTHHCVDTTARCNSKRRDGPATPLGTYLHAMRDMRTGAMALDTHAISMQQVSSTAQHIRFKSAHQSRITYQTYSSLL